MSNLTLVLSDIFEFKTDLNVLCELEEPTGLFPQK